MSHEQGGSRAKVPGGKICFRHDSNNYDFLEFSCDSCDDHDRHECATDNGREDKTRLKSKYNILLACLT